MRAKTLLMTTALTLLAAAAATAQPGRSPGAGPGGPGGGPGGPGGPAGDLWQALAADFDADQDGVITLEEFGNAENTFDRLDHNDDGVLTVADFEGRFRGRRGPRMHRPMGGRILFAADADGDRVITSGEWADFLAALDANGDGLVHEDEIHAIMARGDGFRRPEGDRPHAGGFLDRDEDGVLEVEDFEALFAALDADGDGEVTGDELPRPHRHWGRR